MYLEYHKTFCEKYFVILFSNRGWGRKKYFVIQMLRKREIFCDTFLLQRLTSPTQRFFSFTEVEEYHKMFLLQRLLRTELLEITWERRVDVWRDHFIAYRYEFDELTRLSVSLTCLRLSWRTWLLTLAFVLSVSVLQKHKWHEGQHAARDYSDYVSPSSLYKSSKLSINYLRLLAQLTRHLSHEYLLHAAYASASYCLFKRTCLNRP